MEKKKKKKHAHTKTNNVLAGFLWNTLYPGISTTELSFTAARTLEIFLSSCIRVNKWAKGDLSRT